MSKIINIAIAAAVIALGVTLFFYLRPGTAPTATQLNIEKFEKAVNDKPDDPTLRANLGAAYLDAGRYDDAIRELQTALSQAPNQPILLLKMGVAYEKKGDLDNAIDQFSHAADAYSSGQKYEAYYQMAQLEFNRGSLDAAKGDLQKSFADGDITWTSHYLMGQILEQQGDKAGALKEYQAAAQFNPNDQDLQNAIKRVST